MSINDSAPIGSDEPDRDIDHEQSINPATPPAILVSLAHDRPALRAAIAANPSAPVHTLLWLRDLGEPAIDRALAMNPTAIAAKVVRRTMPLPPPVGAPTSSSNIHAERRYAIDHDPTPPQGIVRNRPGDDGNAGAGIGAPIEVGPEPASHPPSPSPSHGREAIPVAATLVGAAAGAAGVAASTHAAGAADASASVAASAQQAASGSLNGVGTVGANAGQASNGVPGNSPPRPPGPPVLPGNAEPAMAGGRRSFATWAILLVPLLFVAGTVASYALFSSTTGKKQASVPVGAATSVRTAPTSARLATTSSVTPSTSAPSSTAAAAVVASTVETAPAETVAPSEPDTEAPAAPPPTSAPRRTATTAKAAARSAGTTTTVRTTAAAPTAAKGVGTDATTTKAVNLAQQLATALANADWSTARTLSPSSSQTDAAYSKDYGDLTDSTVVPVSTSATGNGVYNLRIGLVAHETTSAGDRRTVLFCSHWDVDTTTNTIKRVAGTRLRTATGRVEVATVRAELLSSCAAAALK